MHKAKVYLVYQIGFASYGAGCGITGAITGMTGNFFVSAMIGVVIAFAGIVLYQYYYKKALAEEQKGDENV